jgi:hypothetical protein
MARRRLEPWREVNGIAGDIKPTPLPGSGRPWLKLVNDRLGHAAGDRVPRELVSIMRRTLRSFDPIVRSSDSEFVCALGAVDLVDIALVLR